MSPLYAVLGHPVAHSRSPALHRAWLEQCGLPGDYVALDLGPDASGSDILACFAAHDLAGANLTVPLKTRILPHLARIEPDAARIGAVNTVVRRPEGLVGLNTDAPGFVQEARDLGAHLEGHGLVVGAGGAGLAVAVGLLEAGARQLTVLNRTRRRAEQLRDRLAAAFPQVPVQLGPLERLPEVAPQADLIAVCLSGPGARTLQEQPTPRLQAGAVWIDLNYWMPDPPHLETLASRGVVTGDGSRMLVHQGALAFRAFTGVLPDPRVGLRILASPG